jgi:carboxypeptidase family protein
MQMNSTAISHMRARTFAATGLLALATFAMAAVPARASTRRQQGTTAPDTIRGIVFDSLLHQPIPEATVQANAGSYSTLTDKEGRFTIVSPEKITKITVFHDFLDRSGLGSLEADVTPKTSHSMMVLSTPSIATIWARLCPGLDLAKGRGGIVYGSVTGADGKTRLAGAQVRVSWDFNAPTAVGLAARTADAKTDATGSYYACGAPPNNNVYVLGYSSAFRSGAVTVPGDTLPLRRVNIVLGEVGKTAPIRGIVADAHGQPMVGATIDIDGVADEARTNASGRFSLAAVPTGSRTMAIRTIGYAPLFQPITVLQDRNDEVQVTMVATALAAATITGRQNVSHLQLDFEQRKREGFGTFKDSTEIASHTSIRSVFQGIPSVTITGTDVTSFDLFTPGLSINTTNAAAGCEMNVFIDGIREDTGVLISLAKSQIAAIEVYVRQEMAPGQYMNTMNNCGVVLVWTKLEFNKHKP